MPAEKRGISFPVRNMRGVARPMRVNLVPAPLQFRIRAFSWPRNMPWDLRGKNFHPVSVYGGGWFRWRTWRRKLKPSYRDIFRIRFFLVRSSILCLLVLATFRDRMFISFLKGLWKGRRIIDSDNRFMEVYILFFFVVESWGIFVRFAFRN